MVEGSSVIAGATHSQICSGCGAQRRSSPNLGHQRGSTYCMWPVCHFDVTDSTAPKEQSASQCQIGRPQQAFMRLVMLQVVPGSLGTRPGAPFWDGGSASRG